MKVRPASDADAAPLAYLMGVLGYPATEDQMRARLARIAGDPAYGTFIAEDEEGHAVGMVGVMRGWAHNQDAPFARVIALVVEESRRGSGIGAALMQWAEDWAHAAEAGSIHLTTATHREQAHAFYRRIGYEATGTRFYKRLAS